jgi:hypothetical protein
VTRVPGPPFGKITWYPLRIKVIRRYVLVPSWVFSAVFPAVSSTMEIRRPRTALGPSLGFTGVNLSSSYSLITTAILPAAFTLFQIERLGEKNRLRETA